MRRARKERGCFYQWERKIQISRVRVMEKCESRRFEGDETAVELVNRNKPSRSWAERG